MHCSLWWWWWWLLPLRKGSSGHVCSSSLARTARRRFKAPPAKHSVCCPMSKRPLQSCANSKVSGQQRPQVHTHLIQSCNNCNKPHLNRSKLSPSAVLAAGAPGEVAFMADEAVESIAELRPVEYTAKHYALFLQKMLHKSSQLNRGKIHTLSLNISLLGSYYSIYFRSSGRSAGLDSSPGGAVFMGMGRGQSDSALINTGVQSDGCNTRSDQSEAGEEEDCWWKAIKETEENLNSELCTSLNFPRI